MFSDTYTTCLISFHPTLIRINIIPLMRSWSFVIPRILWLVSIRMSLVSPNTSSISGPLEHVWAPVSATAWIWCLCWWILLLRVHPNFACNSGIKDTSISRVGGSSGGFLLNLPWLYVRCGTAGSPHLHPSGAQLHFSLLASILDWRSVKLLVDFIVRTTLDLL